MADAPADAIPNPTPAPGAASAEETDMTTSFWHGFADMHAVKDAELIIREGDGAWVTDVAGNRYLDATAALWYTVAGYGRDEIADAAAAQMKRISAYSSFGAYTTEPTVELAARIAAMAPMPNAAVFLTSGGSESVETAGKLARRYWDVLGKPEKRIIVNREHGYHGMAALGTSLAGIPSNKAGYGTLVPDTLQVGVHDLDAVESMFAARAGEIAAFIAEPVVGAGGVIPPQDGYFAGLAQLCRQFDVLLIADEVITGFGRTGQWWGSQRYGFEPDMITFAKAITSGYVPLGGVVVGPRVRAPFWDEPFPGAIFRHGYTYSGHATACAAAMANLDILEREDLVGRVRTLEPVVEREMGRLATSPLVGEVRTVGLTACVELSAEARAANPGVVDAVVGASRRHGVLTRNVRGVGLHFSPAFVISEE
ncbi:MAG TPA: aminotransferase class III-fold pyridoxal phosphate-dependent enzyme, partial [Candidatus Limnocylindrales bacterium]